MKPTVIANANANASASAGSGPNPNGITIPINHDYNGPPPHQQSQHPQYHTQAQHYVGGGDPHSTAYGSPGSHARAQQQQYPQQQQPQQQPHPQQQQIPAHFQQDFDFDNDMGMDMFPRSRLGRMAHDPFADFSASRKRSSLHDPQFHSDVFSRYFDDDPDFGFPQFNSLGRRRANNTTHDDDFFNRLPTEFRQYIPDSFGHRRATAGGMPSTPGTPGVHPHPQPHQHPHPHPQAQPQQPQQQQHHQPMPAHFYQTLPPQSPSKKVCDAAIQTEDPNSGRSEVDHAVNMDNLNQHGLRNTMDMGVKSATENETAGIRSHSAPPNEPLLQQQVYHPQQQIPVNGQRQTPPVQQHPQGGRPQFGTQTSPPVQTGGFAGQAPQFHKAYYAPQSQTHPQQKQQTPPPPQTPGGSYIRTIPIFVEGRAEPIINNKEIPNQNAAPNTSASGRAFTPPKQQQPFQYPQPPQAQAQAQPQQQQQQQHRPTPLNTQNQQQQPQQQQQQQQQSTGLPPQTPHTVDSINKIQDIQRDVLALMSCVEQFTGRRTDKEYAYLDEMLTRNLLKLDNIDTNGKESIRLARKEAIKCIQASINVLEAKAEENTKAALANANAASAPLEAAVPEAAETPQKSSSGAKVTKDPSQTKLEPQQQPDEPVDASKIQEPIPLPPPEGMLVESKAETTAETVATGEESKEKETENEATPVPEKTAAETPEAKAEATAEAAAAPAPAPAVDIAAAAETK